MLSDERKKRIREVVHKIHDGMAEAMADADLPSEERRIVLCAVVADIQNATIKYLEHELD